MEKLRNMLHVERDNVSLKVLLLLIVVSYLFSLSVRYIWINDFSGMEAAKWNGEIMLNTNDGYFWAEGARDILAGSHQSYDGSPVDSAASILTAFFIKILPFDLETVILYMPAFLGSLLVVPVILIGRALGRTGVGFFASLIAGIAWSYYNRTMAGYYDTDMLIIVLPTFILWSLILGVTHARNRYLLLTTFFLIAYNAWYAGSYSLNIAMAGMLLLYTLVFDRKALFNYKLLLFIAIAIAKIPVLLQIALSVGLFILFHYLKEKGDRLVIPFLAVAAVAVLVSGGVAPVIAQLNNYIFRAETSAVQTTSLHFFNVVQTVREAGEIPFETFANRISGHPVTFILSTLGYLLLVIRFPVMLLALPMVGLGFLALSGGLRFTVYTVPINALGIGYLVVLVTRYITTFLNKEGSIPVRYGVALLLMAGTLYPNIKHVMDYKVPTVFKNEEVAVLDRLKTIADREDYVVSWWDYGYPIRFYSDTKTLVDGARHSGSRNFPVSLALTYPQVASANMSRLNVEFLEERFRIKREGGVTKKGGIVKNIMDDYGMKTPAEFFEMLQTPAMPMPEKTREVFYYLPFRMLNIYHTVRLFSNLDLSTGQQYADPFLYQSNGFRDMGDKIMLGNGIVIDKQRNVLKIGNREVGINSLYVTKYGPGGKLGVQAQNFNFTAPVAIVYMKDYNTFLVMDMQTLNSTYMQLFIFENYDPNLFEPVILSPLAKVYRLKK